MARARARATHLKINFCSLQTVSTRDSRLGTRDYFTLVAFPSNMFAQVLPLSVDKSSL
jgi:hypothetical protein